MTVIVPPPYAVKIALHRACHRAVEVYPDRDIVTRRKSLGLNLDSGL